MTADEIRECENYALSKRLSEINSAENLAFLAGLLLDHDHFRAKLMSEPHREKRQAKYELMRVYLRFKALPLDRYELAEAARACGAQPIYSEMEEIEKKRIWMPPSQLHEVRGSGVPCSIPNGCRPS